jgi:hypothetical protein
MGSKPEGLKAAKVSHVSRVRKKSGFVGLRYPVDRVTVLAGRRT